MVLSGGFIYPSGGVQRQKEVAPNWFRATSCLSNQVTGNTN